MDQKRLELDNEDFVIIIPYGDAEHGDAADGTGS